MSTETTIEHTRLLVPVNRQSDHIRGDGPPGTSEIVVYGDYLCPYCRRLRTVTQRLLEIYAGRLIYVFRHFPNEAVHPGATFAARASEAAGAQRRFWEMHDQLYEHEPPLSEAQIHGFAGTRLGREVGTHVVHHRVLHRHLQTAALAGFVTFP